MCFIVSPGRGWRGVDGRDVVQRPNVAHFSFSLFWPSLFSHPLIRSLVCRLFSSRVCLAYTLRSATNCQSYPRTKPKQCCQTSATHSPDPICISFVLEREIFCVPCFIKSMRGRKAPRPLSVFRDDLSFQLWEALL